jgi:Ala-tRNA(Pro) deacylase
MRRFLEAAGARYRVVRHPPAAETGEAAHAAQVPAERTARSVLLEDASGYVVAVLPSSRELELDALGAQLHRRLALAPDAERRRLFRDCAPGAVPALARPYGVPIAIDESLVAGDELWFEAGDPAELVQMRAREFLRLAAGARLGTFSH